jgi:hypothetical protein
MSDRLKTKDERVFICSGSQCLPVLVFSFTFTISTRLLNTSLSLCALHLLLLRPIIRLLNSPTVENNACVHFICLND